ncbi:FliM/FliN family flagellar motor switch protein [Thermodesulfobacteriota bacterium]
MNDALAQEEIDALLNAANLSDSSSTPPAAKQELADDVAEAFLNSTRDVLLSLLGGDADISKVESGAIPIDILTQEITEPVALGFVESSKGLNSFAVLLFDEKKTTVVTDLVLMGDGVEKDKFSEDDTDALKEAINQIMGSLGQNLSAEYGETVAFEQVDIELLSPADALTKIKDKLKEESFHNVLYSLKIDGKLDAQFRLLLPLSIENEIARLKKNMAPPPAESAKMDVTAPASAGAADEQDDAQKLDMILDLNVEIIVKLGETVKPLSEIIKLTSGNILTLDKTSNAPVDVIVNNRVIATGDLIVIPPYNFAIKVTKVDEKMNRIKNLSFI